MRFCLHVPVRMVVKEVFKFSLVIKINLIFVYRTLFSPDPSAAGRRKIFDESSLWQWSFNTLSSQS